MSKCEWNIFIVNKRTSARTPVGSRTPWKQSYVVSWRLLIGRLKGDDTASRVEVVQGWRLVRELLVEWWLKGDWLKVSVSGCDWMKRENEQVEPREWGIMYFAELSLHFSYPIKTHLKLGRYCKVLTKNVKFTAWGWCTEQLKLIGNQYECSSGTALLFSTVKRQAQTVDCLNPWLGNRLFCSNSKYLQPLCV